MAAFLNPPLVARDGRCLRVLGICRISTVHQDQQSLADQEASYRRWLEAHSDLPFDLTVLASQGSGELLERDDYLRAIELVEQRQFDLVLSEDLARICRRVHAHLFCELCEDNDTRLIALNDHVDTGREDWRLNSFFAVMRHELYNKDTSNRIRRSLRNRFMEGGVFQFPIYGYIKPPGKVTDDKVRKDPAAEPVYKEWFQRLERGARYAEIADWLNAQSIEPGPASRLARWTGPMVGRVTHNPLLKGVRVRNDKKSRRINKTGARHSVKAPREERLERACPHLAFFEADYYDRVVRLADQRNAGYRRKTIDGSDPRKHVPKKRTVWPGQHLRCGACGRIYHWTGVKDRKMMMCSGATAYRCWNSLLLNGELAIRKLTQAIWDTIEGLPNFDADFLAMLRQHVERAQERRQGRRHELAQQLEQTAQQIQRVMDHILQHGGSRSLQDRLEQLEVDQVTLEAELRELSRIPTPTVQLPSINEVKRRAEELFTASAATEGEFGRLMQQLVPHLTVHPHQLCDGGAVVLRAQVTVLLSSLLPGLPVDEGVHRLLRYDLVVDLFEPPQRVIHREKVMQLRALGWTERQIAAELGITQTAVQRAAALDRRMKHLDTLDPYQPLQSPPEDYPKLRRHRHPRDRFEHQDDQPS